MFIHFAKHVRGEWRRISDEQKVTYMIDETVYLVESRTNFWGVVLVPETNIEETCGFWRQKYNHKLGNSNGHVRLLKNLVRVIFGFRLGVRGAVGGGVLVVWPKDLQDFNRHLNVPREHTILIELQIVLAGSVKGWKRDEKWMKKNWNFFFCSLPVQLCSEFTSQLLVCRTYSVVRHPWTNIPEKKRQTWVCSPYLGDYTHGDGIFLQ